MTHLSVNTPAGTLFVVCYVASATAAALHALLTKPDPRSAMSWIALCWFFPLGGSILYWLFGINRVTTHAQPLEFEQTVVRLDGSGPMAELVRAGDVLSGVARVGGNNLEPLHNGEVAFPRMLESIAQARQSVWLATYIFQTDRVGRQFVEALRAAVSRGVSVRVLVDGIGEWYDWPHVVPLLRRAGVTAARFLPPRLLPPSLSLNCRNHRKVLVVDGVSAFMGGMNLGGREVGGATGRRMTDIHFALQGPVVAQLGECFAADWHFAAGEALQVPAAPAAAGESICRVVTGGPDGAVDKLLLLLLSAIAVAQRQVLIMTPYFIPPLELIAALQSAALRGLEVSLLLPQHSNLRYVDWATMHWLPALIERGVRVFLQVPPFSHAKLFIVDAQYAQIGSVNVDTRSLRLNFEIAVELFDARQCLELANFVTELQRRAAPFTLAQARHVSLFARLRNSLCWLVSPYL